MFRILSGAILVAMIAGGASAQCNCNPPGAGYLAGSPGLGLDYPGAGWGGTFDYLGAGLAGGGEPLFQYDDPEPWKHGYLQVMPFYGGHHFGRPYNYHHVFSQVQTSVGWGMPHGLAYSQQWWHRYEAMADPGRAQTEPGGYYGQTAPLERPAEWSRNARPLPQTAGAPLVGDEATFTSAGVSPMQYRPSVPPVRP